MTTTVKYIVRVLVGTIIACSVIQIVSADTLNSIIHNGVKENPDRYVSLDLLVTHNEQDGVGSVPMLGDYGSNQFSQYNDRGVRGQIRIPLTDSSTFLVGGNWYTGDYAYDATGLLPSQVGQVHGYGVEVGFRFYIHAN